MRSSAKIQDFYKQKSWCDAKDGLGVWRVGRIKKRQKNVITVHFDGWSDKWKQTYCLHSALIAPFRMHSAGYTGQKKKALRDWDFNEDSIRTSEGIMTILVHENFTGLSPYELTLFLRGDLYNQVDCLMNYTYSSPSKEVSRVIEFFSGIVDMVIKWMSIVPSELKNCDLETPDNYLYKSSDAIYKSGYELMDILNNIFGFVPRTYGFYEKYKQYANCKIFIQTFFNKEGMKHFINMLKLVHLEHFWHFVINIPGIFSISTVAANEKYILILTETLINQIQCLPTDNAAMIIENQENVLKFMKNMENMIDLVLSPHQKENWMEFFRKFFKLSKSTMPKEIDIEASNDTGRISLISPRNKPPPFPTPRKVGLKFSGSPPKRLETLKSEIPDSFENFSTIKEYIDKKHAECISLIEDKFNMRKGTESRLETVFKEHHSCDQQEFSILNTIEFLLSEDNLEEALRVIRWRKKILKISAMNGWEVAQEISKRTFEKLDVTAMDLIEANIKNFTTPNKSMALS